jgi:hypothetical protein
MANIPGTRPFEAIGAAAVTPIALGLTNTLTYNPAVKQVLYVQNASGASVTATLDGSGAPATIKVQGTGSTFNSAAGAVFTIAAGAIQQIPLSNYRAYLVGDVTLVLSLATSVNAWLLEV